MNLGRQSKLLAPKKTIAFIVEGKTHLAESLKSAHILKEFYNIVLIHSYDIPKELREKEPYIEFIHLSIHPLWSEQLKKIDTFFEKLFKFRNVQNENTPQFSSVKTSRINFSLKSPLTYGIQITRSLQKDFVKYYIKKFSMDTTFYWDSYLKKIRKCFRKTLTLKKIDLIILCEANVEYPTEIYIQEARRKNIHAIVLPHILCSPSEPAMYYLENSNHQISQSIRIPIIYRKLQNWVYNYNGISLLRLPLYRIKAILKNTAAPPLPWIQESCTANSIISESTHTTNHYLSLGIPKEQIKELGSFNFDLLAKVKFNKKSHKERLCSEFGWDFKLPLIGMALPPSLLPLREKFCDFDSYEAILDFWIKSVSNQKKFNVILSIHPRFDKANFRKYETNSIRITDLNVTELIPLCDLYIASISATIKWAIICGVPVLNYDIYRLRYNDFESAEGVLTIEDKSAFETTLSRLLKDKTYLQEIQKAQESSNKEWGVLDGKCTERLITLIDDLIVKGAN